jgi:hypothetical protein
MTNLKTKDEPMPFKFSNHVVEEINREFAAAHRMASPGAVGLAAWLINLGGLLNEYLPTFIEVLQAIAKASGGSATAPRPTVAAFFAAGHAMFCTASAAETES